MPGLLMPFMNNDWPMTGGLLGGGYGLRPQPYRRQAGWTPEEEQKFRRWMQETSASAGTSANADHPLHAYDYRGLYRSQQQMAVDPEDQRLHGSSQFKQQNHPNRYVIHNGQMIDSITGEIVDPWSIDRGLNGGR